MAHSFEEKLCALLVKKKVITLEESASLQKDFKGRSKETFDNFLLSEDLVQKDVLLTSLSELYEVPSFDVSGRFFEPELLMEFPQDVLVRYGLIPLKRDEDILVIVASEPDNEELLPELAEYVSDEIQFYVGIRGDIIDAVREYYQYSPFTVDSDRTDIDDEDELYEDVSTLEDYYDEDSDDDEDD